MEEKTKWAIVTGGSKGIGRAIVKAFLSEGFAVLTCARREDDLATLKAEIDSSYPHAILRYQLADLSQKTDCHRFGEWVLSQTKVVDVLVNNAGYFLPGQIHNEPEGTFESMLQTNLFSAYYLTRVLLPSMMEQKNGYVFNICSTASFVPYVNGGSYCISKHALLGFGKVLREELKSYNIRVTSVMPGATLTASWDGVDLPKERFMKPEDVAQALVSCWKLSGQTVVEELVLRPQLGDI